MHDFMARRFLKTQVLNSPYALFTYIISDLAQEGLELFLN
jgi:hypothetical protein